MGDSNAANIWKNRIVGYGQIDVEDALAHENNWRIHSMSQQEEMRGILETIGVIQNIIINKRTSDAWPVGDRGVETMIDGHMRIALAMRHGQQTLPVTYVDLDPGEEAIALATFDPIGALAGSSREQLDAVLREIETDNTDVQKLLGEVAERAGLYAAELGPEEGVYPPGMQGVGATQTQPDVERKTLAERFIVPPFSVLDARQGYWQERKRAWLALGIQSELGRGENAAPGGSSRPATSLVDGHTVRGDGRGRPIPGGGKWAID